MPSFIQPSSYSAFQMQRMKICVFVVRPFMNTFIRVHALCDVRVTLKDQLWLGRLGVLARVAVGLLEHIPAVQVGRITVREDDVAVLCERRGITHREAYGETHMERKKENTRNVRIHHHHHHFVPSFSPPFSPLSTHSYVQCVGVRGRNTGVKQMLRLPQSQCGFSVPHRHRHRHRHRLVPCSADSVGAFKLPWPMT